MPLFSNLKNSQLTSFARTYNNSMIIATGMATEFSGDGEDPFLAAVDFNNFQKVIGTSARFYVDRSKIKVKECFSTGFLGGPNMIGIFACSYIEIDIDVQPKGEEENIILFTFSISEK